MREARTTSADGSYWLATTPDASSHPPLEAGVSAEVAVLGGGLAGVTTALLLARAGVDVVLVEAGIIGSGVSGTTTAKVTSAHGSCYQPLTARISAETARCYGTANERALAWMRELVTTENLDCDWEERDAWTYTTDPSLASGIAEEAAASIDAGLPATLRDRAPLPFDTAAAVQVTGQAQCHARRYVLGLAELAVRAGVRIREQTRATGVSSGSPCRIATERGDLHADRVVVATHYPILDRGLFFARLSTSRSYCVAARVKGPVPEDMYYAIDTPSRSLRTIPLADGGRGLIAGGDGHETGKDPDAGGHYRNLWDWTREHFDVEPHAEYRWSAQDDTAVDGIPYAGALHPRTDRLYVITGLRKWGFTNGTAAAHVVADAITGRENPSAGLLDPQRMHVRASAAALLKENASVVKRFVGDRIANRRDGDASSLGRGEGAVVTVAEGRRAATYRDGDGALHAVSPTCTHMGCEVRFNPAERSWDCPCHGSRYDVDGHVLEGPAVKRLAPVDVPGEADDGAGGPR
ncbi:MAG: hypothetical protein AVDCRST_MAG53-1581 [uncultured Solirubrobacteraceae bacterium]|uniref:Rieske domain-containing protein n=1 Tax=uncultured Solirubrobacteraceae bacterium TaxID=1162706 RepID=A0A6J4S6Y6_9ACTN|nr:MAG: hypothetical protein AVDCRST_MAG53-1581 [uncultured Solirubrobacteraceae bacterium]